MRFVVISIAIVSAYRSLVLPDFLPDTASGYDGAFDESLLYGRYEEIAGDPYFNEKMNILREYPLNVPNGELLYLGEFFPELCDRLPQDTAQLRRFEPWDAPQQEAFFREYPDARPFAPFLSFDCRAAPSMGTLTVSGYDCTSGKQDPTVRIQAKRSQRLSAEGIVAVGPTYASWLRRRVRLGITQTNCVQIGNFTVHPDLSMWYGFFSQSKQPPNTLRNWLYGNYRTWNGIACSHEKSGEDRTDVIIHTRPTESIAAFFYRMNRYSPFSIGCGASGAVFTAESGDPDTMIVFHGTAAFDTDYLKGSAVYGIDVCHPHAVPMLLQCTWGAHKNRWMELVLFPSSNTARKSHLYRIWRTRINGADSTRRALVAFTCSIMDHLPGLIEQHITASLAYQMRRVLYKGEIQYCFTWFCRWDMSYGLTVKPAVKRFDQWFSLKATGCLLKKYGIGSEFFTSKRSQTLNVQSKLTLTGEFWNSLFLSPFLLYRHSGATDEHALLCGCKQRFRQFAKTQVECNGTVPLYSNRKKEYILHACASFTL